MLNHLNQPIVGIRIYEGLPSSVQKGHGRNLHRHSRERASSHLYYKHVPTMKE